MKYTARIAKLRAVWKMAGTRCRRLIAASLCFLTAGTVQAEVGWQVPESPPAHTSVSPITLKSAADGKRTFSKRAIPESPPQAPGEIIVKFKAATGISAPDVSSCIPMVLERVSTAGVGVLGVTPLFPPRPSCSTLQDASETFVARQRRAPAGAVPTDIGDICLIKLDADVDLEAAIAAFKRDPSVQYAEPNHLRRTMLAPNDPLYPQQWSHQRTHAEAAWAGGAGSADVVIAVLDTGVDHHHEDLSANIWRDPDGNPGRDFVDIDTAAYAAEGFELIPGEDYTDPDGDPSDFNGHGTHCSGIAAAAGGNSIGIVGAAPNCRIMPVRAGFSIGRGGGVALGLLEDSAIAQGIVYASDNGADIISMSFGSDVFSQLFQDAIAYAASRGVVLVAAAGNSASGEKFYPAALPQVVSVTATGSDDTQASYSNYGYWTDLAAPGGDAAGSAGVTPDTCILSTVPKTGTSGDPSGYGLMMGTSMACPYVAGVCGLMLSRHSGLGADEIRTILRNTADDVGYAGWDKKTSYGRVNAAAATAAVDKPVAAIISSPEQDAALFDPSVIAVSGTAGGSDFARYTLEVMAEGGGSWVEIGHGASPITDGELGRWESPEASGATLFRLSVFNSAGVPSHAYLSVTIHRNVHPGWPVTLDNWPRIQTMADINGDGVGEIICSGFSNDEYLNIIRGDGSMQEGWPVKVQGGGGNTVPAVGDINGDGANEILICGGQSGPVQAFDAGGDPVSGWPRGPVGKGVYTEQVMLLDMDGDSTCEVVATVWENMDRVARVYAWKGDGTPLPGWPVDLPLQNNGQGFTNHATCLGKGDINGDGVPEIVILQANGQQSDSDWGRVACMAYDCGGNLLDGWPVLLPEFEFGAMGVSCYALAVGDADGDGRAEIFFSTQRIDEDGNLSSIRSVLHALRHDGSEAAGWPIDFRSDSLISSPPVMGDLDKDGLPEIILYASKAPWNVGSGSKNGIYAYRGDGSPYPGYPVIFTEDLRLPAPQCPTVADVDGDGFQDILAVELGVVRAYDKSGELIPGWPKHILKPGFSGPPPIGDVDGDGKLEMLVGFGFNNHLLLYDLDASANAGPPQWPMYGHDPRQTNAWPEQNPETYSISGTISGEVSEGVEIILSGAVSATATSGHGGAFSFTGLANGSYTIRPRLIGYTFTPRILYVAIDGASVSGCGFASSSSPVGHNGEILILSFSSSYKENISPLREGGMTRYEKRSSSKFSIQAAVQFGDDFDLAAVSADTELSVDLGNYGFSGVLRESIPKSLKLKGPAGGSAKFLVSEEDQVKGNDICVEKIDLRWDSKRKLTVRITGTPATNDKTNILDLSSQQDGADIQGAIQTFALIFNNAGASFSDGDAIAYHGSKRTRNVCKGKGDNARTFELISWMAKGRR